MLRLQLLSDRRISVTCDNGGGECHGNASDIANFITFCRVNRKQKQRACAQVESVEFDIFPIMNVAESKFYPKSWGY